MRLIDASYEDGSLKLDKPLPLRAGERVAVVVVRKPDPSRWDLARLAATGREDLALAASRAFQRFCILLSAAFRAGRALASLRPCPPFSRRDGPKRAAAAKAPTWLLRVCV